LFDYVVRRHCSVYLHFGQQRKLKAMDDDSSTAAISGERHSSAAPKFAHDKHCFIVMPFGRDKEEERWFSGWYKTVIEPVVNSAGYEPILAATEDQPGAINDEIRAHLVFDPLVIVDLGGRTADDPPNPNVMYELGIRHAFGLPLVLMAWEGQRLPFDVSNQRAIMTRRDFMDIEPTRQKLGRFIFAAKEGKYYNPMENVGREAAIDAASLALGEESLLGALAREVRELRTAVVTRGPRTKWERRERPARAKLFIRKAVRSELWKFAQGLGLDNSIWNAFLSSIVPEAMKGELHDWTLTDWQSYLATKAPELAAEQKLRVEQKESVRTQQTVAPLNDLSEAAYELLLPAQPWPKGVHRDLADKLGISPSQAAEIINDLIRLGKFKHQVDGVVIEPINGGANAESSKDADKGT
jgi:hypothetical protein